MKCQHVVPKQQSNKSMGGSPFVCMALEKILNFPSIVLEDMFKIKCVTILSAPHDVFFSMVHCEQCQTRALTWWHLTTSVLGWGAIKIQNDTGRSRMSISLQQLQRWWRMTMSMKRSSQRQMQPKSSCLKEKSLTRLSNEVICATERSKLKEEFGNLFEHLIAVLQGFSFATMPSSSKHNRSFKVCLLDC